MWHLLPQDVGIATNLDYLKRDLSAFLKVYQWLTMLVTRYLQALVFSMSLNTSCKRAMTRETEVSLTAVLPETAGSHCREEEDGQIA